MKLVLIATLVLVSILAELNLATREEVEPEESREGDSNLMNRATATIDVKVVLGAAFTVTVTGKDVLGHSKVCHNVVVGSDCKLHNIRLNSNITLKYHCIPNTYVNYQPVIPGNLELKTWGTCWVPNYESVPDNSVVDVTRVSARLKRAAERLEKEEPLM